MALSSRIILRQVTCLTALVLLLVACATPPPPPPAPRAVPYKVGQPYQVAGVWYYPREQPDYDETGIASWYGPDFNGKPTANGEIYDMNALSAAHKTLPMPSTVRVTNLQNGRSLLLRINDRGPFVNGRIIDISRRGAQLLGFNAAGTVPVRVQITGAGEKGSFVAARPNTSAEERQLAAAAPTGGVSSQVLPGSVVDPKAKSATPAKPQQPALEIGREPVAAPPALPDARVEYRPVPAVQRIFVQAGAFRDAVNAERLRVRLARAVPGMQVSSTTIDGRSFFRVRSVPQASVAAADATLAQMISVGVPGARIVVD